MIDSFLNYVVTIYPVAGSDRENIVINNKSILVDDVNQDSKYGLAAHRIHYDIFKPEETNAVISLYDLNADTTTSNKSTIGQDIKRGDIVQIIEETTTTSKTVFLGYVEHIGTSFNLDNQTITLICPSPLKQFTQQQAIRTVKKAGSYSTKNFTQWAIFQQTTIEQALEIIIDGTILILAHDKDFTSTGQYYKFIDATGTLAGKCTLESKSWVWVQPTTTKLQALNTILYPYQYMMYMDQKGTLILTPLSTANQAEPVYSFSVLNMAGETIQELIGSEFPATTPIIAFDTLQGLTTNRYITSLANGTAELQNLISVQDLSGSGKTSNESNVQTTQQIFSRQQDLLLTGYYTNQITDIQSLNDQMLSNPILMNFYVRQSNPYINSTNTNASQIQTETGGKLINGVLQLFGGRALSEALENDTVIMVSSDRSFTAGYDLPLAKMVQIDCGGRIDEDGVDSFLCKTVDLIYSQNSEGQTEATIIIGAVKPFTHIFLWDEQ